MTQLIEVSRLQNAGQELVDLWQQSWEANKQCDEEYAYPPLWLHGAAATQRSDVLMRRNGIRHELNSLVGILVGRQVIVTTLSDSPEWQIRKERGTQRDHALSNNPEMLCKKRLDKVTGLVTARSIPPYSENTMELEPVKKSFFSGSLRYCFEIIDPETGRPQVDMEFIS
jgi:hypothetical protein